MPDVVQHVMARGIEGREIFRDSQEREEFLRRLSGVIKEGNAQLYAWCLMPNHVHLLLRRHEVPLATVMRRLMTGYAVWYNRRNDRRGHLFQNRYKSFLVEEDAYFLELVRYIHLNPVRGGMLTRLSELDRYRHSGHSVIMGYRDFRCQDVHGVLEWFADRETEARREYRSFVEAGFHQGEREDLRGAGSTGSTAGHERSLPQSDSGQVLQDSRILGSEAFVAQIFSGRAVVVSKQERSLEKILDDICRRWEVSREHLLGGSRVRTVCQARRMFLLLAHEEAGESIAALGRLCGLAYASVRQAIEQARAERNLGQ